MPKLASALPTNPAYRAHLSTSVPAVTSVSPNLGELAGGVPLTVTGTGFTGATGGTIGGVALTSFLVVNDTTITAITPAKAAGTYDVAIAAPGGTGTLVAGFEAWAPSLLTLGVLLMPGAYDAGTGVWSDSSGNSRHATYASATKPPAVAGCPDLNGTSHYLAIAASIAEGATPIATLTQGEIVTIFSPDTADADLPNYSNPAIVAGSGASPCAQFSSAGFRATAYDEHPTILAYVDVYAGAAAVALSHIGYVAWNGSSFKAAVNASAPVSGTIAAGTLSNGNVGATTEIGRAYGGAAFLDGRVKLVAISATELSPADRARFRTWALGLGHL